MIQIDKRELNALIELAARALKSQTEALWLETVTAKWQAQVDAMKKAQEQKGGE